MKDHIIIIFTAKGCHACESVKSTGEFGSNYDSNSNKTFYGHRWDANFFWKLLTGETNPIDAGQLAPMSPEMFTIYEVELDSLSGHKLENFSSFTKYFIDVQEESVHIRRRGITREGSIILDGTFSSRENRNYDALLAKTFPRSLENYFNSFPTFAIFSSEEWVKGINSSSYSIYGRMNGASTVRRNGRWIPDFDSKSPRMDPVKWSFVMKGLDLSPPEYVDSNEVKKTNTPVQNFKIVPLYDSKEYKLLRI